MKALGLYAGGEAVVENHGSISTHASAYAGIVDTIGIKAYGEHTTITNAAGATLTASSTTERFGGAYAMGIDAGAKYVISVVNDGSIIASGHSEYGLVEDDGNARISRAGATGIYVAAGTQFNAGSATVVNNGDITASALSEEAATFWAGGGGATGIMAVTSYDATLVNNGRVTATMNSSLGVASSFGMFANGKVQNSLVNSAGASILAYANTGSLYGDYYGGKAFATGAEIFGGNLGVLYNAGTIVAQATVTPDGGVNTIRSEALALAIELRTHGTGLLVNVGDVHASASADFGYATAFGARLPGNPIGNYTNSYETTLENAGTITATADADYGDAWAVGAYAYAVRRQYTCDYYGCTSEVVGGDAQIHNTGDLRAVSGAHGGVGGAYGSVALGAFAAGTTNAGHITAVVDADDANAVGSLANSFDGNALLQNDGVIGASATGTTVSAIGASAIGSYGNVDNGYLAAIIANAGDIVATATGDTATAIGVKAIGRYSDGIRDRQRRHDHRSGLWR